MVTSEVVTFAMVIVREAQMKDAPAIADVSVASRKSARRGLYADPYLDRLSPEPVAAEVRDFLEEPADGWHMWVAEEAGNIVAFAKAGPWADGGSGSVAELDELYVEPSRFRQGIGTRLLCFVESELAAAGFDRAVLWVLEDDRAAQAFYVVNGWSPGDRSKELPKDRPRVVQLWHKWLSGYPRLCEERE